MLLFCFIGCRRRCNCCSANKNSSSSIKSSDGSLVCHTVVSSSYIIYFVLVYWRKMVTNQLTQTWQSNSVYECGIIRLQSKSTTESMSCALSRSLAMVVWVRLYVRVHGNSCAIACVTHFQEYYSVLKYDSGMSYAQNGYHAQMYNNNSEQNRQTEKEKHNKYIRVWIVHMVPYRTKEERKKIQYGKRQATKYHQYNTIWLNCTHATQFFFRFYSVPGLL